MIKILYLCTHNRCRSIIGEAVTNSLEDDRIMAVSAGSQPAEEVHPLTLQYLQKHGISTNELRSKSWDEYKNSQPDVVITLCDSAASESCPVWLEEGKLIRIHWGLSDPSSIAEQGSEDDVAQAFNQTINILEARLKSLLSTLNTINSPIELKQTLNNIGQQILEKEQAT